jgi:hypothetical protein
MSVTIKVGSSTIKFQSNMAVEIIIDDDKSFEMLVKQDYQDYQNKSERNVSDNLLDKPLESPNNEDDDDPHVYSTDDLIKTNQEFMDYIKKRDELSEQEKKKQAKEKRLARRAEEKKLYQEPTNKEEEQEIFNIYVARRDEFSKAKIDRDSKENREQDRSLFRFTIETLVGQMMCTRKEAIHAMIQSKGDLMETLDFLSKKYQNDDLVID